MILRLCCAAILLAATPATAATTWYVATTGDDTSAGTSATASFATWQRAIDLARAGDTILISPGIYTVSGARDYGAKAAIRSGTRLAPITLRGNGGVPTLDCSGLVSAWGMYCLHLRGVNWWQLSDIDVAGAPQTQIDSWVVGIFVENSNNVTLDRVSSHDNQGPGIRIEGTSANVLLRNSDAFRNYDPKSSPPGGNADGIEISTSGTGNRAIGNRAWENSDDGFDLYNRAFLPEAAATLDSNWSFRNGFVPGTTTPAGNGVGFKIGVGKAAHLIERNVAFDNGYTGFDSNSGIGLYHFLSNTGFRNGQQEFSMNSYALYLRNNVGYGAVDWADPANNSAYNSWQLSIPVDAAQFQSVDPTGTDGPRQPSGALPVLPFLRPAPDSSLIDRGVAVGLPFNGAAPDLGAYESAPP